jgi:hypothetical protein
MYKIYMYPQMHVIQGMVAGVCVMWQALDDMDGVDCRRMITNGVLRC